MEKRNRMTAFRSKLGRRRNSLVSPHNKTWEVNKVEAIGKNGVLQFMIHIYTYNYIYIVINMYYKKNIITIYACIWIQEEQAVILFVAPVAFWSLPPLQPSVC